MVQTTKKTNYQNKILGLSEGSVVLTILLEAWFDCQLSHDASHEMVFNSSSRRFHPSDLCRHQTQVRHR